MSSEEFYLRWANVQAVKDFEQRPCPYYIVLEYKKQWKGARCLGVVCSMHAKLAAEAMIAALSAIEAPDVLGYMIVTRAWIEYALVRGQYARDQKPGEN